MCPRSLLRTTLFTNMSLTWATRQYPKHLILTILPLCFLIIPVYVLSKVQTILQNMQRHYFHKHKSRETERQTVSREHGWCTRYQLKSNGMCVCYWNAPKHSNSGVILSFRIQIKSLVSLFSFSTTQFSGNVNTWLLLVPKATANHDWH